MSLVRHQNASLGCVEGADRSRFAWLGAMAFLAVGLARVWTHEPWRDECNVWLMAQGCATPGELLQVVRYDGHPYYLYGLAWALAQGAASIFAMQALHVALAALAAWLILRYAPWSRREALLCVAGYFIAYEYAVVCRAYVLAVIAVALLGMAWRREGDLPWLGGTGVMLLTQSSIYGLILALALVPSLALATWNRYRRGELAAGWCVLWWGGLVVGAVLCVAMVVPPDDGDPTIIAAPQRNAARLARVVARCGSVLYPVPNLKTTYLWNTNVFDQYGDQTSALLGGLALVGALWVLRRDREAFLFFLLAVAGIGAFSFLMYSGSIRHHGHVFLALVLALWISADKSGAGLSLDAVLFRRGLFAVQALAALWMSTIDWVMPFSANRDAARWIAGRPFDDHLLVTYETPAVNGVSMSLQRPICHLNRQERRWGTYLVQDGNEHRCRLPGRDVVFEQAARLGDAERRPVLLLMCEELTPVAGFRALAAFPHCMIRDECLYLYARECRTEVSPPEAGSSPHSDRPEWLPLSTRPVPPGSPDRTAASAPASGPSSPR